MAEPILHAKALPWGGSIGIRISRAEADRLGIKPGQELDLKVLGPGKELDFSRLRTFRDGIQTEGLDQAASEAAAHDLGKDR